MSKEKKNPPSRGNWFTRLFHTGSSNMADEMDAARAADVEAIVSPVRQVINNFLERKLAVAALILLVFMFIFMFVGPLFMPKYKDSYTEVTQQNMAPTMSLMKVPKELKNDIKTIDSYGSFSVGLSNAGKVYVWGSTQLGTTGIDISDIPQEVQDDKIALVAAGIDHIVAISESGKIYCWGAKTLGQYGTEEEVIAAGGSVNPNIAYFPQELADNGVDVSHVKKLTCGYQASAILMDDGKIYLWGNKLTYANMDKFLLLENIYDIDFTLNYIVGVTEQRNSIYTGSRDLFNTVRPNIKAPGAKLSDYLNGRKIDEICTTNASVCLLLDDGSLCFAGDFPIDALPAPELTGGEEFTQIVGGSYHYSGLTNKGNVYSWGADALNQCQVSKKAVNVSEIYSGSFQTYAKNGDDDLCAKWGLKGYIFGTDTRGADIFQRIIQGGKMTMTVGAVAVIISSVIGIIVGIVSGYFGGKIDVLLMRVAEIFSAIPFLPFAMILSAVMGHMSFTENQRIFIIMCILGVLTWPGLARLVRGQVLLARESEYVTAAKAMGVKESVIAFKHILPNVMSVILVSLMLDFGTCMLTESSLSYLGFGVMYPRPTWGNMLNGANNETVINAYWWQWVFTSLFLAVTTICINIVGDALRDVMDPKASAEK